MINDEYTASLIKATSKQAADSITNLTRGNFIVGIFMVGSMQSLWGLIRALKMILLSGLVDVIIPVELHIFLEVCVVFSNMDLLNGEDFYGEHFKFKDTSPIGSKWEFFGVGDSNFINNSGSYFVVLGGILCYTIFKKIGQHIKNL